MSDPIINKDAKTGRIVSDADAAKRPDETYALEVQRTIELERAIRGALHMITRLDQAIAVTRNELGLDADWLSTADREQIEEWRQLVK